MGAGTLPLSALDRAGWARPPDGGPAVEVPARLRALVSPDGEARAAAWHWWETWFLGGHEQPALARAVPFLLGLLADGGTPDRERALGGLSRLVERPPGADGPGPGGPVRAAVIAGVPALVPLLEAADVRTAGAAAELLAWLPERAREVLPALRGLCARAGPGPERATALIALGTLAGTPAGSAADRAVLEGALRGGPDPDRWAAAVGLCRAAAPAPPTGVVVPLVTELAAAHRDPDGYPAVRRTRFHDDDVAGLLAATLRTLPAPCREAAGLAVSACLSAPDQRPEEADGLASALVVDALGDLEQVAARALTPWQRAVLGALPGADPVWASGELGRWLGSAYGLPGTPGALARWCAARP
ncbi:hypothetical protein [Streptomyces sp. NPDC002490]|uniref:hypothetical protein n=1 Tax=Streptomyces sp. NPDC002490 TaxID=3154416 RepID=UPI00331BB05C